jgi:ABC-2 type transport system ATP-binding protein
MSLLFLDEPTVGLDPSARRQLLDYIRVHAKSGLTVFFTTHIMEEAEYLCDELAIVDKGKIIACGSPTDLKQKYWRGAKTMELSFKDPVEEFFVSLLKATINKINSKNSDGNNKCNPSIDVSGKHTITITVANAEEIISEILQLIYRYGLQIENIAINPPSLEEVFLSILNNDLGKFGIK